MSGNFIVLCHWRIFIYVRNYRENAGEVSGVESPEEVHKADKFIDVETNRNGKPRQSL
jgi:hypothetical protein